MTSSGCRSFLQGLLASVTGGCPDPSARSWKLLRDFCPCQQEWPHLAQYILQTSTNLPISIVKENRAEPPLSDWVILWRKRNTGLKITIWKQEEENKDLTTVPTIMLEIKIPIQFRDKIIKQKLIPYGVVPDESQLLIVKAVSCPVFSFSIYN